MRLQCGIILAAVVAIVVCAGETKGYTLADEQARATPDWFRKGVMYQIQPRAFTPEGTMKASGSVDDTDNDDYDQRMEKTCGGENQTLGLALCFAMDGIPLIYNGQEIADSRRHSIFGHSPEVTIDWSAANTEDGRRRREMVCALAALRRDNPAMTAPGQTWLDNDRPDSVLALRRGESATGAVIFIGNFSKEVVSVRVDSVVADKMEILLSNGATVDCESFRLAPWGFAFATDKESAK